MNRILTAEETLDPAYLPPKLVGREKELGLLYRLYRESLTKGVPHHHELNGGIGSGKTALARRLGEDLQKAGKLGGLAVHPIHVNCWRRSSDRTILLELLRSVGVSLPDRGYSLAEMLDVFEQGIRRQPRHLMIVLDEVSAVVRQGTKLVYLLTRPHEVGLGSISLLLVSPEDVLPYVDPPSRSSFGVTHRLQLAPYGAESLAGILTARAELALRKGSWSADVIEQIARVAAPNGDARFALEVLSGAAHAAELAEADEIRPEDVRAAKGSIYPTLTETKLQELSNRSLLVLLALARSLRGPRSHAATERVRQAYQAVSEEYAEKAVGRIQFWRTVKELEREGLIQTEPGAPGDSARLSMDEVPVSFLQTLVETRLADRRPRKA
ncbi:MAG: AAA family ATPase [Thermoplasmata archaeon]|nr:AAA family ATPase [Thermoplasmata archaeon]